MCEFNLTAVAMDSLEDNIFKGEVCDLEAFRNESIRLLNELILQEMGQEDVKNSVNLLNSLVPSKKIQKKRAPAKKKKAKVPLQLRKSSRLAKKAPAVYVEGEAENEDKENVEEDEEIVFKKRRTSYRRVPNRPLSVEVITENYIAKISHQVSSKVYSTTNGTSCHQCRQKTLDSKTICKSSQCVGIRGQFCGVCLLNRYGEHAEDALRNPTWTCPPCRGICNCSICRNRRGMRPTGIMTPLAQAQGHKSVKDYLISLKELDKKVIDVDSIKYMEGDVLGFDEQGNACSVTAGEDDVMGFQGNIPVTVFRLPNSNLEKFEQALGDMEAEMLK